MHLLSQLLVTTRTSSSFGKISGTTWILVDGKAKMVLEASLTRPQRSDAMLVDLFVALRVMFLDVLELRRAPEGLFVPVQLPQPLVQRGVPGSNVPDVALEMLHVDGVESDDSGVQSHVGFRKLGAEIIGAGFLWRRKMLFRLVERAEEVLYGRLVRGRLGGEASFIHSIVDVIVRPCVRLLYLFLERVRQQIHGRKLGGKKGVKFVVEHANNLRRFVVHDLSRPGIVERRNREAAGIIWIIRKVDVAKMRVVRVHWVRADIFSGQVLFWPYKTPACRERGAGISLSPRGCKRRSEICKRWFTFLFHVPMHRRVRDDILKSFELSDNQRTMRYHVQPRATAILKTTALTPRAGVRDIEVIAPLLRRKLGAWLGRDGLAKGRDLAFERAGLVVAPARDGFVGLTRSKSCRDKSLP